MHIRVRDFAQEDKVLPELSLAAIEQVVPMKIIETVLSDHGVQEVRERALKVSWIVLLLVLMNLYVTEPIEAVLERFVLGVYLLSERDLHQMPGKGSISYRRKQLGVKAMVALFHRICQPMATKSTKGAFLFGLRLMGIDGHVENVPDTPQNARYFGRHRTGRGESVYPQVQAVYLCELGTRAVVDAGFWPRCYSEHVGARRVMRSLPEGSLLMFDRGLHDYALFREALQRDCHVLARLSDQVNIKRICRLPDGTYLGWLYPSGKQRARMVARAEIRKGSRKREERILVRVIEYIITHPKLPGWGEIHRLITTLLNPEHYPAEELMYAYHERWEMETGIDEMSTHQRLSRKPLRSKTPLTVLQELYGLLIAHYLIRSLIHRAAVRADIDPDRISFTGALRVIANTLPSLALGAVVDVKLSEWVQPALEWMLRTIAFSRLPEKRARSNPRVVKQTNRTKFPAKPPQHSVAKPLSIPIREALALVG